MTEVIGFNRRSERREKVSLAVRIISDKGNEIRAETLDISKAGAAIVCHTVDRNELTPRGDFIEQGKPLELSLFVIFPDKQACAGELKIHCRVVYSRRIAESECQLGLRFISMASEAQEYLDLFMQSMRV